MGKALQKFVKMLIDRWCAGLFLVLFSPLFLGIAIGIKREDRGPVFFRQDRLGKNGRVFKIIKFRSMVPDAIHKGSGLHIQPNDDRITRIGRMLRKTSLDELPQLINILKGEMSFIGPRPPVPTYPKRYEEYEEWVLPRFEALPGMTGLAQVSGRNDIDWYERFRYDIEYVRDWSLLKDIRILFLTFKTVIKGKGIYKAPS